MVGLSVIFESLLAAKFGGEYTPSDILLGAALVILPLAFFVYRGHRWAMVLWLIVFTVDRATSLGPGIYAIAVICWWLFLMPYFYQPLQVENARRISDFVLT